MAHDDAFALLNDILDEEGSSLWLVMDRLDEAFAGRPDAEVPALRALFRTYLDLSPYQHVRLKLFVRKDLFRRIVANGFVNLTHVNARRIDISWDEDSLRDLLYRRLKENASFVEAVGGDADDAEGLFRALLPEQVDAGSRKPTTWTWMMGRIRDGNDVRPPRNLIDLVSKTLDGSIAIEGRRESDFAMGNALLLPEAFKSGLSALSKDRVEDTLLAEAGERAQLVERFRGGKAEHNRESLVIALALDGTELDEAVQFLVEIGFLGKTGGTYKIPLLYRDGLSIRQGKAFAASGDDDEEEE